MNKMEYNISYKMPEGSQPKYKKAAKMKDGQYGPYVSVCIEDMQAIIAQAKTDGKAREFQGKHYFNMACFENTPNQQPTPQEQHSQAKANAYKQELDDEIPF